MKTNFNLCSQNIIQANIKAEYEKNSPTTFGTLQERRQNHEKKLNTLTWEGMWVWGSSLQALGTHDMHGVVKARPFLQKSI